MNYNLISGFTFGIIGAYVVLLVVYLKAETKNDGKNGFKKATAFKLTLSGIFCFAGIFSFYLLTDTYNDLTPDSRIFIMLGLFAAFAGDYFLQYIRLDEKKYKTGIVCFLAAHILFIIALVCNNHAFISIWILSLIITAVLLICMLFLMKKQNWRLGGEKTLITIYTVVLTFMTAYAVAVAISGRMVVVSNILMAAGAVLFWISDLLLGIWNYHTGKRLHANLNWITYFSGNLLIALSIMPVFLLPLLDSLASLNPYLTLIA